MQSQIRNNIDNLMCEDDAQAMAAGKASGRAANARGRVGRHTGASAEAGSIHVGALHPAFGCSGLKVLRTL